MCAIQLAMTVNAADNPRLIVRADDMGSSHASNVACLQAAKEGIATSIEVMAVGPWFPETIRLLHENPGIDVGLHLVITSEWDNIKWRPLTCCPSLTDANGYFLPQISPNKNYPGLSIKEHQWKLEEIEQEFRAQIELALKNIPQISHLSGHMGSTFFAPEVLEMATKLSAEYYLPLEADIPNGSFVSYQGPHATLVEKEESFTKMLDSLKAGKNYLFVDHPALDTQEMRGTYHIGYENVAIDRQGVTDLFTSDSIKNSIQEKGIQLVNYNTLQRSLPRSTPQAESVDPAFMDNYLKAVEEKKMGIHSIMVLRNGKVVGEHWLGNNAANIPHVMFSVSKTFTATAVGFAVQEGLLSVHDKVISFFPDLVPSEISPRLAKLEIRHLLTMSSGHGKDPTGNIFDQPKDIWVQRFLNTSLDYEPGEKFVYNSLGTYVLSAIVQKVTGQKVIDYLYPRLFRPLGINGIHWEESPQGINCGGWGLYAKTEDMAKLGQFILQKGQWNGKQLLSTQWFDEATSIKIYQGPADVVDTTTDERTKNSDWQQGYCYQMWRCRHNAIRADGAQGQLIVIIPDKNAVVAVTACLDDMQAELNLVWNYVLPALKD